jgi:uncharacterized RDD family membrane protein YckC
VTAPIYRESAIEYSQVWRRLVAFAIDGTLVFIAGLAIVYLPMRLLIFSEAARLGSKDAGYLWRTMPLREKSIVEFLWVISTVVVPWLYYAAQECSARRATVGKRVVGIAVTGLDGQRISFGRASARFFARFATLGIGYVSALFTARRQGLHDLLSGCVVIRDRVMTPSVIRSS